MPFHCKACNKEILHNLDEELCIDCLESLGVDIKQEDIILNDIEIDDEIAQELDFESY